MAFTNPLSSDALAYDPTQFDPSQFDPLQWQSPGFNPISQEESLEQQTSSSYWNDKNDDTQIGQLTSALQNSQGTIASLEQRVTFDERELATFGGNQDADRDGGVPIWGGGRPVNPGCNSPLPAGGTNLSLRTL